MAAAKAAGAAGTASLTFWKRVKSQRENLFGMALTFSLFVVSSRLLGMDRQLERVKKDHENAQVEADELRRGVSGLKDSVLEEVSRAASARESVANLKSRLQVLLDAKLADMNIYSASGKQQSESSAESEQQEQGQQQQDRKYKFVV